MYPQVDNSAIAQYKGWLEQSLKTFSFEVEDLSKPWLPEVLQQYTDIQTPFLRYLLARYEPQAHQSQKEIYGWLAKQIKDNIFTCLDFSCIACDYRIEPEMENLGEHQAPVTSLAMLHANNLLASCSYDHTIKIWDLEKKQCVQTLTGHTSRVYCLAVLSDGALASGSWDDTIRLWDIKKGECTYVLQQEFNSALCLCALPDNLLASGHHDSVIIIWDTKTHKSLHVLEGHKKPIRALTVTQDEKLVSGSKDGLIKVWNIKDWTCLITLDNHNNGIYALTIQPNGWLAAGSYEDNIIKLWNLKKLKNVRNFQGHVFSVRALAILPNGKLVSGSRDSTIKLWGEKREVITLSKHTDWVYNVIVLPNGSLASSSEDRTIKLWSFPRSLDNSHLQAIVQALEKNNSVTELYGIECTNNNETRERIQNYVKRNQLTQNKNFDKIVQDDDIRDENRVNFIRSTGMVSSRQKFQEIQKLANLESSEQIYIKLAEQGYTWPDIKKYCLFNSDFENDTDYNDGADAITKLIKHRNLLDEEFLKQAISSVFPKASSNQSNEMGFSHRINQSNDEELTYWHCKIAAGKISETDKFDKIAHVEIKIIAPGSRDLTSDVDTTIAVTIHKGFNIANENIKWPSKSYNTKAMQAEILIQAAIIHYFHDINNATIKISSAESRDSNLYVEGFMAKDSFPKLSYFKEHKIKFNDLFENKSSWENYYHQAKRTKHVLQFAASLAPLFEYMHEIKNDSSYTNMSADYFKEQVIQEWSDSAYGENLSHSQFFLTDIEEGFKEAKTLLDEKIKQLSTDMPKSSLEKSNKHRSTSDSLAIKSNKCYITYLLKVAEKKFNLDAQLAQLISDMTSIQRKLEEGTNLKEKYNNLDNDHDNSKDKHERKDLMRQMIQTEDAQERLNNDIASLKNDIEQNIYKYFNNYQDYYRLQTKANLFALEAYVNYAAQAHVVRFLQKKEKIKFTNQLVIGSELQQIGFRSLHAYQIEQKYKGASENVEVGDILLNVSKYIYRQVEIAIGQANGEYKYDATKPLVYPQKGYYRLDTNGYDNIATKSQLASWNRDLLIYHTIKKNDPYRKVALKLRDAEAVFKREVYKKYHPQAPALNNDQIIKQVDNEQVKTQLRLDADNSIASAKTAITIGFYSKLTKANLNNKTHAWGREIPKSQANLQDEPQKSENNKGNFTNPGP